MINNYGGDLHSFFTVHCFIDLATHAPSLEGDGDLEFMGIPPHVRLSYEFLAYGSSVLVGMNEQMYN